jgi:hypothetical protein
VSQEAVHQAVYLQARGNLRAVASHWEGDLFEGTRRGGSGVSAIATLVERSTRFVVLVHPAGGGWGFAGVACRPNRPVAAAPGPGRQMLGCNAGGRWSARTKKGLKERPRPQKVSRRPRPALVMSCRARIRHTYDVT